MTFPTDLTNAVAGVTEIKAEHLNNLEAKVGIDGSAEVTSLDYLLKNPIAVNPGHKHTLAYGAMDVTATAAELNLLDLSGLTAGHVLRATGAAAAAWGAIQAGDLPTIPVSGGGTGLTTFAQGDLLYASAADTLAALPKSTTSNQFLKNSGADNAPAWESLAEGDLPDLTAYAKLAGRATGQTLNGGTAASENLTLDSTAHATKGYVLLNPSGGYLGIGTTSPGYPVDILVSANFGLRVMSTAALGASSGGTASLYANNIPTAIDQRLGRFVFGMYDQPTGNAAETALVAAYAEEAWVYATNRGTYLRFETVAPGGTSRTEKFRISGAGNIGISQTTFGTSATKVLAIGSGTAPSTSPADCVQLWSADRGGAAGKAGLHIRSEDGTSHVFSDRVGIGTTSPSVALDISGAVKASSLISCNAGTAAGGLPHFTLDNTSARWKIGLLGTESGSNAGSNFRLWAYDDTGTFLLNALAIDRATGNVGFGVVTFGSSAARVIGLANGAAPSSSPADAVQLWCADRGSTAGKAGLHIRSEDGTSHVFSDYVGIGTTTPSYLLDVASGNVRITQNIGIGTVPYAYNNAGSEAIVSVSRTLTDATASAVKRGVSSNVTAQPSAEAAVYYQAVSAIVDVAAATAYNLTGYAMAVQSVCYHRGNTTLTNMYGVYSYTATYNGGLDTTGTVTNLYGVYIGSAKTASSTITNAYGLYITGISGTTAYDIYAGGAGNKNYFAGNVGIGTVNFGTSATRTLAIQNGTAPSSSPADSFQLYSADQAAGNACPHFRTENGAIIKLFQGAALTTALTTLTYTAPGTPDYAIQDLTNSGGYGFVTKDEGNSVLKVIANLQARVNELEARLQAHGFIA